jgi:hypothetical protein
VATAEAIPDLHGKAINAVRGAADQIPETVQEVMTREEAVAEAPLQEAVIAEADRAQVPDPRAAVIN